MAIPISPLLCHPKVDFPHAVVVGVAVPHGWEDLTDGAELLLDRSLIGGIPLYGKKSGRDALGKNYSNRTGSLMHLRLGAMCRHLQKRRHWHQVVASLLKTME